MKAATAKPARRRRWTWRLAVLALALATGAWWVNRQLEPERLTAMVLARAGAALGLELSIDGTPDYSLRPEPRLRLPGLRVRQAGASEPLMQADSAELSLPWSTLRDPSTVVVARVELLRPRLDAAALARWQASRPDTGPFVLPTVTDGIKARNGEVLGEGWALRALDLDLPELLPGKPFALAATGRFEQQGLALHFEATLALANAAPASDYSLQAQGRIARGELDKPYLLSAVGTFDAQRDVPFLQADRLTLRSESPLPDLDAKGGVSYQQGTMGLSLGGELLRWPAGWPALPAPLLAEHGFAFVLDYGGPTDFSNDASLQFSQGDARAEIVLSKPSMQAWLADSKAGPLPPLQGRLTAPSLQLEGYTLEGVQVSIEDEDAGEVP